MATGTRGSNNTRSYKQKRSLKLGLDKVFSRINKEKSPEYPGEGSPSDRHFTENGARLLEALVVSCRGKSNPIRIFSARELMEATDGYDERRLLGSCISEVYRGIHDGRQIAVKRGLGDSLDIIRVHEPFDLFLNEVVSLSQVNHRNVVRLLGCCIETRVPMLVYEFVPGGKLYQHIHVADASHRIPWADRLRIAIEVADALSYLHTAFHTPIVHGNIESSNILLDHCYSAKLVSFAFSELVSTGDACEGSTRSGSHTTSHHGHHLGRRRSEKNDVYYFGLVLIELLTRKVVNKEYVGGIHTISLQHFTSSVRENSLGSVLDESISSEGNMEQVMACAWVAIHSTIEDVEERPTMKELVQELRRIRG